MEDKNIQGTVKEIAPRKNLGFWALWALGVGSVVGDGIFLLLGQGVQVAGPSSVLVFAVAGIIQAIVMISLAELAVGMPSAGAMSVWIDRFLGGWWGYLAGFGFTAGWIIAGGSTGIALGTLTCWYFPGLNQELWTVLFGIIFLTIFAALNVFGAAIAARTQLIMVLALLAVMVVFGIATMPSVETSDLTPFAPYGIAGCMAALPLGTYAYQGAVTLTTAGDECKDVRNLPKALVWSSITFIVVYTVCMIGVLGIIPWNQISMAESPFTLAAAKVFGKAAGFIMNSAGWLAAATCIIMGTLYSSSRVFYHMAKVGQMPKVFGEMNPKTRTPVKGVIIIWALSVAMVLLGTINADLVYVTLSNQITITYAVIWILALVAAIRYRMKCPDEVKAGGFKMPLFPVLPVIGIIGVAFVLYTCISSYLTSVILTVIWMALLYVYYRLVVKKKEHLETY